MTFTKKVAAGQTIAAADFRQYFGDHFSSFVKTGFEVTDDTGLDVSVSAGTAYVKDTTNGMYQVTSDVAESMTMVDNTTNYIFLHSDNGANYLTSSTSSAAPDDAISLATVVTASGNVTSIVDNRIITPVLEHKNIIYAPNKAITAKASDQNNTLYGPVDHYEYLNHFEDSLIKISKLRFTAVDAGAGSMSGTVYYNVGAGDVTLGTLVIGNTYSYTINAESSNPAFKPYIKWRLSGTNQAGGEPTLYTRSPHYIGSIYITFSYI